jgi:hypothetical protein
LRHLPDNEDIMVDLSQEESDFLNGTEKSGELSEASD